MKITYKTSKLSNPTLSNLRQWVENCQEHGEEIIPTMKELASLLEFWRSQSNEEGASAIEVILFGEEKIIIKDGELGEYILVEREKEAVHG